MNYQLWDRNRLIQYLKTNKLWAKRSLSQNFLVDQNALGKIVEAAELKPDDFVVEIGPGLGVLTQELVREAGEIVSIEKDDELTKLLQKSIDQKNFRVINGDILEVNLNEIIGDNKYKVVANIPYAITSKIIELFLARANKPEMVVLLVQKEVAERICAKPGDMSILAISVQLYGEPEIVDIVPANSFFPAPKVDSAILRIRIEKQEVRIKEEKDFFRLVHIGFASRRKTLLNNLSAGYPLSKEKVSDILKSIGLNENTRAQELNLGEWGELLERVSNTSA